jgi:hypothetical protein
MTVPALLALALVALLSIQPEVAAQEQKIYKWMDAEGVVHYTARPPEGVEYEEVSIELRDGRNAATGGGDPARATEEPPRQPEMTPSEPEDEAMEERCAQARSNIEDLNRYENITVAGEDGEQRMISDEERQEMIDEAQGFIDEWC